LLIALGLSVILGGLHALTPGHGKTLVAAYLVGSRGTAGHAVALGGIVTFTHTASVIAIGLLALLASQFIVPNVLVPALEILSGLLVVYLGLRLLWTRWRAYRHEADPHHHNHIPHHHDHEHHHIPERVEVKDLLTLGISGGLVPCPEALGVMLIAIGLNRILLGLGMVVAFSFGLAAVLIIIGILLVRSKSLLDRLGRAGGSWQTLLPVISAALVTLLGLGIMMKGLLPYLSG
jgi:ABC-type nickel/cobalt efflux system permease component RcnA